MEAYGIVAIGVIAYGIYVLVQRSRAKPDAKTDDVPPGWEQSGDETDKDDPDYS